MPHVSTDDYMAVEVTETGHVKLTMDMGAATGTFLFFSLEISGFHNFKGKHVRV